MKYALLFCAGLCFSGFCYAQNLKANPYGNADKNRLKVTLLRDSLFITDKGQPIPVTSVGALDSLIKKLPNPGNLTIHFESENAEPEKIRSIMAVLNKCRCHITSHSISHNKN